MPADADKAHRRMGSVAVALLLVVAMMPIGAAPAGASLAGTIEVMLLGDSITDGVAGSSNDTGYRRELWLSQVAAGHTLDFVGTRSTGIPNDFDKQHEGHPGMRADEIRDGVTGWLTTNPADIVLLHIGTNDISQGQSATTTANDIGQILNNIKARDAATWVIVAQIVPRDDGNTTYRQRTIELNSRIADLVAARVAAGDRVRLTDMYSPLNPAVDIADGIHPSDSGYAKMAALWDAALDALVAPDTTPPEIELLGPNPQTLEVDEAYVELGATATDFVDGDLSGDLTIDASAVDTSVLGTYQVTYDVSDAAGNAAAQVVRTVEVVDTTPPTIVLVGANPQVMQVGGAYVELGAAVSDNQSSPVGVVIDSSQVDVSTVGSYQVTYDATDASGNRATRVVRTVYVQPVPPGSGGGGGGGGGASVLPSVVVNPCPGTIPDAGFSDLAGLSDETKHAVDCLVVYEISKGTSAVAFSPFVSVSRWQMALFLTRQLTVHGVPLPAAVDQGFADIGALPSATRDSINQLALLGIAQGTSATTFDPGAPVTRWQMALFLTRLLAVQGVALDAAPPSPFLDVGQLPVSTQLAINKLAAAQVANGTSAATFDPQGNVLRWHMALFLTRVLVVGGVTPG